MRRIKKRHAFIHRSSYRVFALLRPRDIVGAPSCSPPAKPGAAAGARGAVAAAGRNSSASAFPLPAGGIIQPVANHERLTFSALNDSEHQATLAAANR